MFTGLVQALGRVVHRTPDGDGGARLTIREEGYAPSLELGESISVNGACLTVVRFDSSTFDFQIGPESLHRTTLGALQPGHRVNLERSLRVGDRMGGHYVTGHVDTVGELQQCLPSGEWQTYWFTFPAEYGDLLIPKGSIAIDGISLTVVDVEAARFSVMLIPHTLGHTTLGAKRPGDTINLEFDPLGKYVQKILRHRPTGV